MKKLLIINYHSIFHPGLKEVQHFDPVNSVYLADFMAQLDLLSKQDIPVIGLDELDEFMGKEAIVITFDSGFSSDYEIAFPLLEQYNFKASFFPVLSRVPEGSIAWEHYKEISDYGHIIGSGGTNGDNLNELTNEEQAIELIESKNRIENCLQREIKYFSIPGGIVNNQIRNLALESGYLRLLDKTKGLNDLNKDEFVLKQWTIVRNNSLRFFNRLISLENNFYRWREIRSDVYMTLRKVIGNYHSDRLNYYMHKF